MKTSTTARFRNACFSSALVSCSIATSSCAQAPQDSRSTQDLRQTRGETERLFANAHPTRMLWVSPTGGAGGDGSRRAPFGSIQAAVDAARPGTAVMVGKGSYVENVKFLKIISGTPDAPIWLVSADGPQAAHITAAAGDKSVIVGGGSENIIVEGFDLQGGKNGIQFSQNGFDYHAPIKNIVVRFNRIKDCKKDGIKVNGGDNVLITDNVISETFDNGVDFVGIVHGLIANNDVSDIHTTSSAIGVKGGSFDIVIRGNKVTRVAADGISVGGWMGPQIPYRPKFDTFEASRVDVIDNHISAVEKRAISFRGAIDSRATGNYFQAADHYFTVIFVDKNSPKAPVSFASRNLDIDHNVISRNDRQLVVVPGNSDVRFDKNTGGTVWNKPVGARLTAFVPPAVPR